MFGHNQSFFLVKKMKNQPSPSKSIVYAHKNQEKQRMINDIIRSDAFTQLETHRDQCFYIYNQSKAQNSQNKVKITKEDIAYIYGEPVHTVKYHIQRAKEQEEGMIQKNGRPFKLNEDEMENIRQWIEQNKTPPLYIALIEYIQKTFSKSLDYNSLHLLLRKMGYETVDAKPIEENRYNVKEDAIKTFFEEIKKFAEEHSIPPFLAFNFDEEGNNEFTDAHKIKIIVKSEEISDKKQHFYPVKRKPNRTTFVGCVAANGATIKPMIIIKRATIEKTILLHNYGPDQVLLGYSPKGYITKELFDQWLKEAFVPSVKRIRQQYGYYGPGIVIADGCTAHSTPYFNQVLQDLGLKLFLLPPHSSNQLQVLDLGVFAIHKSLIRRLKLEEVENESEIVQIIVKIMNSWISCCTPTNIQSAWRAMGAIYELEGAAVRIKFSYDFAVKLLGHELTAKQRMENHESMLSAARKRISIDDFNHFFDSSYAAFQNPERVDTGTMTETSSLHLDDMPENESDNQMADNDSDMIDDVVQDGDDNASTDNEKKPIEDVLQTIQETAKSFSLLCSDITDSQSDDEEYRP